MLLQVLTSHIRIKVDLTATLADGDQAIAGPVLDMAEQAVG